MIPKRAPDPELLEAVARVLTATGKQSLCENLNASELTKLLNPRSTTRTLLATFSQQRRPAFAKERRKKFEKAAKLAGDLHALLNDGQFPIAGHLAALPKGSGFPSCESEGDPWEELLPLASFTATVNGLARLQDRLTAFVVAHGDEPFIDPTGFSLSELMITGPVLTSFNTLVGRERFAPAQRSRDPETGEAGGPFVRYAVAVMKELNNEVSAETVMAAISKKAAYDRNGGKSVEK